MTAFFILYISLFLRYKGGCLFGILVAIDDAKNVCLTSKSTIMKLFRQTLLIAAAVSVVVTSAVAQTSNDGEKYSPSVYTPASDGEHKHHHDKVHKRAVRDFAETERAGHRELSNPQFIFTTPDNHFSLAIGGFVNLRTSYDFGGAVDNIDFVPYDIPMSKNYASDQRVMMDASTSRLYLKAVVHSNTLGRVVVFSDMDFRGGEEFSYIPRLRSAYVSFKGLTIGRDVTTFCDLDAAPKTIDFQGPNAYNFSFNEMIRYEYNGRSGFSFGIAAERPVVNATYGESYSAIMQRVPDGIAYLQYQFGRERVSHLRLSGVIRDMYLHNNVKGENTTKLGWGLQLSGHLAITRWVDIYMNGVYGEGITPYIQDLTGSPYDMVYNPNKPNELRVPTMWGWQAAAQVNIMPQKLWVAGGYSEVGVDKDHGFVNDSQYMKGSYLFANAFYKVTPNITFALEYLHGTRRNMSDELNSANRLSIMAQYNF